jgi:hypothetical protein
MLRSAEELYENPERTGFRMETANYFIKRDLIGFPSTCDSNLIGLIEPTHIIFLHRGRTRGSGRPIGETLSYDVFNPTCRRESPLSVISGIAEHEYFLF